MDEQSIRERMISSRALQLLADIARGMEERHYSGVLRTRRYQFRAVFRPDEKRVDERATPSYSGIFSIEGKGRGIAHYYHFGSDDRKLARIGWVPVVSVRLLPRALEAHIDTEHEAEEGAATCSQFDAVLNSTANCLFVAPRLVPPSFREDTRRFMRDYFGDDSIRFFDDPGRAKKGKILDPWTFR